MKTTHLFPIEILESRIAPAGLVDVIYDAATGELTLTGDAAPNVVRVTQVGPNLHRIDGVSTDIETVGVNFFELGKLTKLTYLGGDSGDLLELFNLTDLTSLDLSGDAGVDSVTLDNVTVKGPVALHGGTGTDFVSFQGLLTSITGNVTIDSAPGAGDGIGVQFDAQTTVIGGLVLFTGGGGSDSLETSGSGAATFAKGIDFTSGGGTSSVRFVIGGLLTVGKLPTGESISYTGGDDANSLTFDGGNVTMASGIRMTGAGNFDGIDFDTAQAVVKLGKLATGQSILFDGGLDQDTLELDGSSITLAGGIEIIGGDGITSATVGGAGSTLKIGKLSGGQSIRVTGGADDDALFVEGANVNLAGGVELAGGSGGTNEINLGGTGTRATIGKLPAGASILFTGGASDDKVQLLGSSVTLAGGIDFTGGNGTNELAAPLGGGSLKLGKLTGGQSLRYTGGTGAEVIAFSGTTLTFAGGIEVAAGDGLNNFDLGIDHARTTVGKLTGGASILVTGGTGTDDVNVGGNVVTLAGGIDLDLGDGSNSLELLSENGVVKVGKLPGGQSIRLDGGAGSDSITGLAATSVLAGGIEFEGEGGSNRLAFDGLNKVTVGVFGTKQSVLFTGTGNADNEMDFGGLTTLAGSLEVTGGTGSEDIDMDGTVKVGKNAAGVSISLLGGDGNDVIDFTDNITLAGSVFFDAGPGNDGLDWDSLESLTIGGSVEMIGGTGTDDVDIEAYRLAVSGGITFTGGDDRDTFAISSDGQIAGDVLVDLGASAAAGQSVTLASLTLLPGGLSLKGALTVDADAANTTTDFLTLTNVTVAKLIDLELGNGVSTVAIDNLIAGDEFRLDTRDGSDIIGIERRNFFGESRIAKLATILAGAASDQITIGGAPDAFVGFPDPTRVRFLGGLTVEAGDGVTDQSNDIAGQNTFAPGVTPTITSVELPVLI